MHNFVKPSPHLFCTVDGGAWPPLPIAIERKEKAEATTIISREVEIHFWFWCAHFFAQTEIQK
jgi:hypothetical protein